MRKRASALLIWTATALLTAACGSQPAAAPTAAAGQKGSTTTNLAAGPLLALPTGLVYMRVVEFYQPGHSSVPSQKHVPGFVYVADGRQILAIEAATAVNIKAGESSFLPSSTHTHINPDSATSHWYFIAVWSATARSAVPVVAYATVPFATADLVVPVSAGGYVETLRLVSLNAGGRTNAHMYGGVEMLFVLDGSVTVRASGKSPTTIGAEHGTYLLPGTASQEFSASGRAALFLIFVVTPLGTPYLTPLNESP
jgi:quercetin dioxygenase-like cupin family protein